jgi:hypothetical protein
MELRADSDRQVQRQKGKKFKFGDWLGQKLGLSGQEKMVRWATRSFESVWCQFTERIGLIIELFLRLNFGLRVG